MKCNIVWDMIRPIKEFKSSRISDDFQTPSCALNPLISWLSKEWLIWECACGNDNLGIRLRQEGFQVLSTDILMGTNFLSWCPEHFDCIVTNPPYSLKEAFLRRAYELGKAFAFLLPLTTFETSSRQKLFKDHGLQVIFFDKRINFEVPSGKGSGSWFATAWFTNGLNLPKDIFFVSL